jgi:hypothetical protein
MSDKKDRNGLPEAEIAERLGRAARKMMTTPPQPRRSEGNGMPSKDGNPWSKAEAALPSELQHLLRQLRDDYITAARLHVPKWKGGPSPEILAELIRQGWHK